MDEFEPVLTMLDQFEEGTITYSVLGYHNKPSSIHARDAHSNEGLVMPIAVLQNIINLSVHKRLN